MVRALSPPIGAHAVAARRMVKKHMVFILYATVRQSYRSGTALSVCYGVLGLRKSSTTGMLARHRSVTTMKQS